MVVGMATGAVLGAAGAMMATQSKRQMRRNVRKVMKGAENAVMQLDKMAAILILGYFVLQPITACVSWNGRSKSYLRSFLPICLKMKRRILSRRFSYYTSLLQNFRR